MRKIILRILSIFLASTFHLSPAVGLPVEDLRVVTNDQYFRVAQELIREAKHSVRVMMFEMVYYTQHGDAPTNVLIRELIGAKKRGVRVEVILEVREGQDRVTKGNRRTGKILSEGGVEVVYDSLLKTTHAKLMIVDEQNTLLGSTNWTYSALSKNNEVSVVIRSKEVAKALLDYFVRAKGTGGK